MARICISYKKRSAQCTCSLAYKSAGASGGDLSACIEEDITIGPMQRASIPTGVFLQIPENIEGQIRPRSGLAMDHGITLLNSPGTIDSDYRGEIKILLINFSTTPFTLHHGDRIAQIVFTPTCRAEFTLQQTLETTIRNTGGFGSTGI